MHDNQGRPVAAPTVEVADNTIAESNIAATTIAVEDSERSPDELIASFPEHKLKSLIIKISNPRWVVPVLPEQELECLLNYAIELTRYGIDHDCEPCMRFYRDGLTVSFMKILTDDAVNSWKNNIHHCILNTCEKFLQLCTLHMKRDNPYLLDILAIVFDPDNKFHTYNASRVSDKFIVPSPAGTNVTTQQVVGTVGPTENVGDWGTLDESQMFAKSPIDSRSPRGWLTDLINRFGQLGGFDNLLERFNMAIASTNESNDEQTSTLTQLPAAVKSASVTSSIATNSTSSLTEHLGESQGISLQLIYYLLRPFGLCHEYLTVPTIRKYFEPIWQIVPSLLDGLSDAELKREVRPEGRSDAVNGVVRATRCLASRLPNQEAVIKDLEMFRLKMILRLLKISSFNGKMNALNEINKMIGAVVYCPQRTQSGSVTGSTAMSERGGNANTIQRPQPEDEMDWLTAERMAVWIKETDVLGIALRDSLHQPQYVEKLEKILRFLIKEKALTLDDLDAVWRAQAGKHEAIVKNVHDLLAKLAWDFSAKQLDHLFECFQASMTTANKRQRERLLELIRRLAEDDKNGVMANKVLNLFWTLAHSAEITQEVMDQALAAHVKILDYSCAQERDAQKELWLDKCVEELKSGDNWALPALRMIRQICCLYEAPQNHASRTHTNVNRQIIIERLQANHTLVILVTNSLTSYLEKTRNIVKINPKLTPSTFLLDGRYPHPQQIQERLDFLKFLLKDGQLWLCADQAKQIWQCLAVNAAFPSDREECFRWFGKLMGDEPDLDPAINRDFFENNLLQLDPQLLSESGIKCFERFFKAVNSKEEKIKAKNRGYILDDEDLIGKDYLWRVITMGSEEIALKAIELMKEVSTALGPRLQENIDKFHEIFIEECCQRLRSYHNNIVVLLKTDLDISTATIVEENQLCKEKMCQIEADKMCRVIRVLQEYIKEADRTFNGQRLRLPLARAHRGKQVNLYIRFPNQGNRSIEDMEVATHSNEMVWMLKRMIMSRLKGSINNFKIDFAYTTNEPIEMDDDRNPISHYGIRDKLILHAKLTPIGSSSLSSPDSSSDSSTGSPPRPLPDMQRHKSELTLPGVIMSEKLKPMYVDFFLELCQLGCDIGHNLLRESSRYLLHLIPANKLTVQKLKIMCHLDDGKSGDTPEEMFLNCSDVKVLYNLEVLHSLLRPAVNPLENTKLQFQSAWIHSGCSHFILEMLTKNNFLPNADNNVKRAAFQNVLRLAKFYLYIIGCALSRVGNEPTDVNSSGNGSCGNRRQQTDVLKATLTSIFNNDNTARLVLIKLTDNLAAEMLSAEPEGDACRKLFAKALAWGCPDQQTINAIIHLAWASATGSIHLLGTQTDFSEIETMTPNGDDHAVCREALEVLTIGLVLNPTANDLRLSPDNIWMKFITSLVLKNPMRHVRQSASEQFLQIFGYCAPDYRQFSFLMSLMDESLGTLVPQYAATSGEFFQLLCRTLNFGHACKWPLANSDTLLHREIEWLRFVRDSVRKTGDTQVHEELLEGHLCLTKELSSFMNPAMKSEMTNFISEIVDDFLFPASCQYYMHRKTGQFIIDGPPPVCRNPHTIAAACELLIALCQNSIPNMKLMVQLLTKMFFSDGDILREWEYLPPVGPRPYKGFCGLKNAGATCYMNSVLQQLFMVPSIRYGLLSATGAVKDENEDFSGETDPISDLYGMDDNRNQYHVGILKHVQAIFSHLGHSALQYYVPRGLWSHFKLQGEPVNLREQQDAVEFFMSLFESLDEGLKALQHPQLMGATLGGCFSDQKICQECPHRYSKEEPFSVLSVDIRNHSSLTESLEQYVKGELLEGADAYHCDKCDKKVVTIKRLCVRKLPPVLAIQLKRFEYDYERVCAIKFNDYFEFPRMLDMEPYTVSGLAKIEGEVIEVEDENLDDKPSTTKYHLTGIVVHSGQASGGHYFSYILHRDPMTSKEVWYKFDDGEVMECKMHEDDELKAQCFGGDYMGEVYDNNSKRMQYRRQKRWWNAYMLFYTRCDHEPLPLKSSIEQLSLAESKNCVLPMPKPIEHSVRLQNIRFLHSRSLFSSEFFNFVRKLVYSCLPTARMDKITPQAEELSLLGVQLASQFLFHTGFRTKKSLRGATNDWYEEFLIPVQHWYDVLSQHIRFSALVRRWFVQNTLLDPPTRLAEYILSAPSQDVRQVFVRLVVFVLHYSSEDEPIPNFEGENLCEQILICVLQLLKGEVAEHGKHSGQYFALFNMYGSLGLTEKKQLLRLNVPLIFMQVALDEGPGPIFKHQCPDLVKLHQVVSMLVRCSDVSSQCKSFNNTPILPNPYADPQVPPDSLMKLSKEAMDYIFCRTSYIKKFIEEPNLNEEDTKLLQYCCWENAIFSQSLLKELLWQCGFSYWNDMRHHTDLVLNILFIEDSWQQNRIFHAMTGVPEEREGLLDTIQRAKSHYQKRAYQIIKCLVQLFRQCHIAVAILNSNASIAQSWTTSVEWLQEELERQFGCSGQYIGQYSGWLPFDQSNESRNGFMLERTQSAKCTLQLAFEFCTEEEQEPNEGSDGEQIEDVNSTDIMTSRQDLSQIGLQPEEYAAHLKQADSDSGELGNVTKTLSQMILTSNQASTSDVKRDVKLNKPIDGTPTNVGSICSGTPAMFIRLDSSSIRAVTTAGLSTTTPSITTSQSDRPQLQNYGYTLEKLKDFLSNVEED